MAERAPAVSFRTLGCKVNQAESEAIASKLLGIGARLAAEDEAEVVVVNTCTVTAEADAKVRKAVRRALGAPGALAVVVTGCLAALDAPSLAALGPRVVVEADKEAVPERVAALLRERGASPGGLEPGEGVGCAASARTERPAGARRRTRAMVKVQSGCDRSCAYCVVPAARGVPASEPQETILAEVRALVAAGVAEVVLTGTNMGRYDGPGGLPGLLRSLEATGIRRVRLSSVEPLDVTAEFLDAARSLPAFMPHLHVPLQSGSDRVLEAMGRGYRSEEYLSVIGAARAALPGLAVTTDVMAGFPGETEEDVLATARVAEEAGFRSMHVFRYSPRRLTRAAALPGRVPAGTAAARARALRALSDRLSSEYRRARAGGSAEVLVERAADGVCEGTSEDGLRVRFSLGEAQVGGVVRVRLARLDGSGMTGVASGDPEGMPGGRNG